jgi:hypothetical protein
MNKKLIKILINKTSYKHKNKKINYKNSKKVPSKIIKNNKNNNNLKKRISLRTNVESGYSATSFPFVFVQPYKYKPKNNNNKKSNKKNNKFYNNLRTTALVAPFL